jgi:hypothetical protein
MWNMAAPGPHGGSDETRIDDPIDDAYDAWKAADAAARVLEREVRETWLRYERGEGAGPSKVLLREMACLRQEARDRLRHAIGLLHEAGYIQPTSAAAERARPTGLF